MSTCYHLCVTKNVNLIHNDLCYSKIVFDYDYAIAAYFCVPVSDKNVSAYTYLIRDMEPEDLTALTLGGAEIYTVPHIASYGETPDEFPVSFSFYFRPHPIVGKI